MAEKKQKVKITEKAKGKLITLSKLHEGDTRSFDGTRIFYRSFGGSKRERGRETPPLVCCNGLGVSTFFWVYLENMFRTSHQVVTWDYRGHGKSELRKNPKNYTMSAIVQDAKAVLDALKIKKAILVGHSLGVQVSLEIYRRWPDRVAGMIFCFGTYGHPMDNFYNTKLSRYFFQIAYKIGMTFPKVSNLVSQLLLNNPLSFWMGGFLKIMHTGMIKREDSERYIQHLLSVDPLFFTSLLKSAQDHSAEDVLRKIKVPTFIMAGQLDQFTPLWLSKKMHRLIPESEICIMEKATHAGLVEQPDFVNLRIEKFIQERIKSRRKTIS